MSTAAAGDDRSVRNKRVVNSWKRHEVSLEFVQVDIKGTIEAQAGGKRANDLGGEPVKVFVTRAGDVQLALTDIVDSLVVDEESAFGVLNGAVCGKDGIVGLYHGSRHERRRVDGKLQLRLLTILCRKVLKQECAETRAGPAAEGVEDQETLKGRAVI